MSNKGTLVFFCGKMGAGKSTLAQQFAIDLDAILLSEDEWLAAIYPEEIRDLNDYIKYSTRIKPVLKAHVQNILNSGISVVMDFPGNTQNQRTWFKEIISEYQFPHKLVYLEVEDQLCLKQLRLRRVAHPERARFDTEEYFHRITSHFQPPSSEEGFNIELVSRAHA